MSAVHVLGPLVAIIALGGLLARLQFLGGSFMADLNKLAYWVALPALLFRSAAQVRGSGGEVWPMLGLLTAGTLVICLLAYPCASLAGVAPASRGTFAQSAFRGNLAYIGIPVLSESLPPEALPPVVVTMTALMAFFNVLAVVVLCGPGTRWRTLGFTIATNPLLVAGLAGLGWGLGGLPLWGVMDRTLSALGAAAVPIALLCIGGSLATTPLRGAVKSTFAAAALKVLVLPGVVFLAGWAMGLPAWQLRAVVVLAACPTAAASYVMASKMGGDPDLAAKSIVASTIFSAVPLALALA